MQIAVRLYSPKQESAEGTSLKRHRQISRFAVRSNLSAFLADDTNSGQALTPLSESLFHNLPHIAIGNQGRKQAAAQSLAAARLFGNGMHQAAKYLANRNFCFFSISFSESMTRTCDFVGK